MVRAAQDGCVPAAAGFVWRATNRDTGETILGKIASEDNRPRALRCIADDIVDEIANGGAETGGWDVELYHPVTNQLLLPRYYVRTLETPGGGLRAVIPSQL